MSRNLREKISLILQDGIDGVEPKYTADKLVALFRAEQEYHEQDRYIDYRELVTLKSQAIQNVQNMSQQDEVDMKHYHTTYAYVDAVIAFLRGKGLIHFYLKYKKGK